VLFYRENCIVKGIKTKETPLRRISTDSFFKDIRSDKPMASVDGVKLSRFSRILHAIVEDLNEMPPPMPDKRS
jgi:hypothetical protein